MTDLISRSAVLALAYCAIKPTQDCPSVKSVVDVEDIERLPAIDAVPVVHARWIYSGYVDADGNRHANCSHCGAGEEHKEEWTDKVPYCWNCGARMDGESEEDTDETD